MSNKRNKPNNSNNVSKQQFYQHKSFISPGLKVTSSFLLIIVGILMLCMFAGCKTIHTESKTTESKTITIKEKDTTFIYKGASVANQNDLDSIYKYLTSQEALKQRLNGIQTKLQYHDAQNKVALTFWLDKYGKLQADCSSKDSSWIAKLKSVETNYEKQSSEIKSIPVKYIPVRFWLLVGFMSPFALIGMFIIGKAIIKLL